MLKKYVRSQARGFVTDVRRSWRRPIKYRDLASWSTLWWCLGGYIVLLGLFA